MAQALVALRGSAMAELQPGLQGIDVATTIFRVSVTRQAPPAAGPQPVRALVPGQADHDAVRRGAGRRRGSRRAHRWRGWGGWRWSCPWRSCPCGQHLHHHRKARRPGGRALHGAGRRLGAVVTRDVRRQAGAVEVLVTAGVVQVNRPREEARLPLLEAGQRVLVEEDQTDRPPQIAQVAPEEISRLLAWQPRQLEFNDTPLGQVVAEFNRDNRVKLVVDDPALAPGEMGGVHLRKGRVGATAQHLPD